MKAKTYRENASNSSTDQLLGIYPNCLALGMPGLSGMGSTILVHGLASPGKTHEFSGFISSAFYALQSFHVFQNCHFFCSLPRPPTCQRICNLFQSRILETKLLSKQEKASDSFLGQSPERKHHPHLRRPDCTKHLSIGGHQLLMHREVAFAISFQPPESLEVG